ncbi:YncE family protein [Streptomyces benahoarensis]|uniref:YncE family protein n=1 Tax=Streptomyces benahoarensis TaxID=2595054 RepID=A0A553YXY7_9ACTN|nr:YncE family protein [Streptomyces benahoarensis]TSB24979.1 YncE family protein [Streptomyces benahoarensis]TSB34039.1 YncE family protein [Streptomyces benahoarensis]
MPQSVRAGREGDVLAVVSLTGPTVSFHDAATDRHLGTTELAAEPHELCFDPVQRLLWCSTPYFSGNYHTNTGRRSDLTVLDADTRRVVEIVDLAPEHGPHGLALDAARGRLYVSVEGSADRPGGVVVIDTATRRPLGRIDTDAPVPHWFVLSPDGTTGYATNKEAPFVSVVDLGAGTLTAKIEVPGSEGLALSPDGARLYVAAPHAGLGAPGEQRPEPGIRVIDTGTLRVAGTLPTQDVVLPVHTTVDGTLLVGETRREPGPGGGQVPGHLTVFTADGHRRGGLEVGRLPLALTSSPDGRIGYVAAIGSSTVDIVDLTSLERLARLDVPRRGETGAHGMAYLPRAV